MARVLTGIQSSGRQHLGNILGAIRPAIEMSKDSKNEAFLFIADLHSLTTVKDAAQRKDNLIATAAAWLACGLDPEKVVFYAQSDLPECTELTWYLNCFTPYPMLANAHSFKDKSDNLSDVNAGLFDYPVLMASDILLYDAELVPVGKDQKQHLEITRDLASSFNHRYGDTFVAPEASIAASVMTIPGTDGRKMSKSYGNTIPLFGTPKQLQKSINKIKTNLLEPGEPKIPEESTVFQIWSAFASDDERARMYADFEGGIGWGDAKKQLFELVNGELAEARERYNELMAKPMQVEEVLQAGAQRLRPKSKALLEQVRDAVGLRAYV